MLWLSDSIQGPWIILGDFNVLRDPHEKPGGREVNFSKLQVFNNYLNECELTDLRLDTLAWS